MYTPSKLRALAAALETPGDLTEQELEDAHDEIVKILLGLADFFEGADEIRARNEEG